MSKAKEKLKTLWKRLGKGYKGDNKTYLRGNGSGFDELDMSYCSHKDTAYVPHKNYVYEFGSALACNGLVAMSTNTGEVVANRPFSL